MESLAQAAGVQPGSNAATTTAAQAAVAQANSTNTSKAETDSTQAPGLFHTILLDDCVSSMFCQFFLFQLFILSYLLLFSGTGAMPNTMQPPPSMMQGPPPGMPPFGGPPPQFGGPPPYGMPPPGFNQGYPPQGYPPGGAPGGWNMPPQGMTPGVGPMQVCCIALLWNVCAWVGHPSCFHFSLSLLSCSLMIFSSTYLAELCFCYPLWIISNCLHLISQQ